MSDLNLVNWTMQEARQLSPEHHMHSDIEGSSSLNSILLGVLEGERGEPSSEGFRAIDVHSVQLTVGIFFASRRRLPASAALHFAKAIC